MNLSRKNVLLEISNISQLEIADVNFVIGYQKYTSFAGIYLSYEEISNLANKDKIFILINALIHQKDLKDFKVEMNKLINLGVNFIVQDIGALSYIYEHKLENTKIIFNSYTLICNQDDFDAFKEQFDVDIFLSNELTHEELMSFKSKDNSVITIYGYTPIYQSYRPIVSLFEEYRGVHVDRNKNFYLKEETREDKFPTIENEYGTVVFRSRVLSRLDNLEDYSDFKYLYVSSMFSDENTINKVLEELNK